MRYDNYVSKLLIVLVSVILITGCSNKSEEPKPKDLIVTQQSQIHKDQSAPQPVGAERDDVRYDAKLSDGIVFSKPGFPSFIEEVTGISGKEDWGRWGVGKSTVFVFKEMLPENFKLVFVVDALWPNQNKPISVKVGDEVKTFIISKPSQTYTLDFDNHPGAKTIEFIPPTPISPKEIGANEDARLLGIGFASMIIETGVKN